MSDDRPIIPAGEVLPPMLTDEEKRQQAERAAGDGQAKPPKPKGKRRTRDRFGSINAFVDCSMADLSRAELAAWLVLWRDTRDGTARTSHSDIAQRAGLSRRHVVRAVERLCKLGLLRRVYRGGLNRGPSTYRVHPLVKGPQHW